MSSSSSSSVPTTTSGSTPPENQQQQQQQDSSVSYYCNHQDVQVQSLAKTLWQQVRRRRNPSFFTSSNNNNQDDDHLDEAALFAKAAFDHVRDTIQYKILHDWSVPVSHTLRTRQGNCGTKASLLVAILRAGGLTAEFALERIDTSEAFVCVPAFVTSKCTNSKSVHFTAMVQLQNQWLRVDPSVDRRLAVGLSGTVGDLYLYQFDGKSSAVPGGVEHGNFVQLPSLDTYMAKKSRVPAKVREYFNLSFEFCRRHGQHYKTRQALLVQTEAYIHEKTTNNSSRAIRQTNQTQQLFDWTQVGTPSLHPASFQYLMNQNQLMSKL